MEPDADRPGARVPEARGASRWAQTPRWVRVFAVVGAVVVLAVVVMLLTGHGPGRHMNHGLGMTGHVPW
jgi:hypothetical protein